MTERNKTILEAIKKVDISVSELGKQASILYEENENTKTCSKTRRGSSENKLTQGSPLTHQLNNKIQTVQNGLDIILRAQYLNMGRVEKRKTHPINRHQSAQISQYQYKTRHQETWNKNDITMCRETNAQLQEINTKPQQIRETRERNKSPSRYIGELTENARDFRQRLNAQRAPYTKNDMHAR